MTRLTEMAKAAWTRRDARYSTEWAAHEWNAIGSASQAQLTADMRVAVERLIEIEKAGERWPDEHDELIAYLRSILTEHDRETTEPPRPARP